MLSSSDKTAISVLRLHWLQTTNPAGSVLLKRCSCHFLTGQKTIQIQIQIFKTLNFRGPINCVPIQVPKRNECKLAKLYDCSWTCMYVKGLVCVCTQVWSWPVQGPYQSETAVHTHSGAGERTSGLLAYVEHMQRRLHLRSLCRAARRASGTTEPAGQLCQYLLFQI